MAVLEQASTRYQVGNHTITRILEIPLGPISPQQQYPEWTDKLLEEKKEWVSGKPWMRDDLGLFLSIHSWLVRTPHHTVLIDTATGNGKSRPFFPVLDHLQEPYLERLQAAGVSPQEVDFVLLTHLHVDHVGWNTELVNDRWTPTFPNAKYIFPKRELEFYTNPKNRQDPRYVIYEDSICPVIESGQAEFVGDDGGEVVEGFTYLPTPGHSQGHMSIALRHDGEEAIFAGDVMHHPLQVGFPQLNSIYCESAEQARNSRKWVLNYAAEREALYFSSHFPESSAGRITQNGNGFDWRYL